MSGITTAEVSRISVAGTLRELSPTLELAARLSAIHLIDYDGGEFDEAYENADHESDQHQEDCDWIYGNCNCRKMEDHD